MTKSIPSPEAQKVLPNTAPLESQFRHKRTVTGLTPTEIHQIDAIIPSACRQKWSSFSVAPLKSVDDIQKNFVYQIETSLARGMYNCDELAAYQAVSLTLRNELIIKWNKTQQVYTQKDVKRVYYLSLEFLMGRALDNAMINLEFKDICDKGIDQLGFKLEDVLQQEPDAGLGNGGLGRLAACYIDSLTTANYPGWGYGLRYNYGIFRQKIIDGWQVEAPDYWLKTGNPWEVPRMEIQIPVDFYGYVETKSDGKKSWVPGNRVLAVAYDFPVPGFKTDNVNNLRLWSAQPTREFDFSKFNEGDYANSVLAQQQAESITAVLYPNDNFWEGKELRLKQQYFWVAASLHDIVRRFLKTKKPWNEFADSVAIQLNDTHPTLAIAELQRIFVDLEGLDWFEAWGIVKKVFGYTNHTVMQEALEKWPVPLLASLLPRHLEIIYQINFEFLEQVKRQFPNNNELLNRVSIVEESEPKNIRMAYLAIIGSHKVNGVAELHSELIRDTIFKDFVLIYGKSKFTNVTNGITPRRWLKQANPSLSSAIEQQLGSEDYLTDPLEMRKLCKFIGNDEFLRKFATAKLNNKKRLAKFIKQWCNVEVNPTWLFDVQVKRIHEYKRQQMNVFGIVWRYLQLKKEFTRLLKGNSSEADKDKIRNELLKIHTPHLSLIGGKAAPGYSAAKHIIKMTNAIADVINNDDEVNYLMKVLFLPDYNVSKAEIIIPASDLSQHISTAGTEASGTSNMKFVMNGGLIIGTVDGANVEITREVGEDNIFLFGNLAKDVDGLRAEHQNGKGAIPDELQEVFTAFQSGVFGEYDYFRDVIESITNNGDHYLVSDDFVSYLECMKQVEQAWKCENEWIKMGVNCVAGMGWFSSDRCVKDYAESIWNVEECKV